jgi:hypothetical protein
MNLNHQIKPVQASLNVWRKLNEVIDALNWLLSMYGDASTDGNSQLQIIPGSRGPVFRMNVQAGNQQPWATDPDGNPTGWLKSIIVDPNYNVPTDPDYGLFDESWMWSGLVSANPPIPWFKDPDSPPNQAKWITVNGGTNAGGGYYWGTGQIAVTAGYGLTGVQLSSINNPGFWQSTQTSWAPINPSTKSSLILYLTADPASLAPDTTKPYLRFTGTSGGYTFNFNITYEGNQIFAVSGSFTISAGNNVYNYPLDPTGWTFDPKNIPGYTYGEKSWLYYLNGIPSSNPNPQVVQTLNYTGPSVSGSLGVVYISL